MYTCQNIEILQMFNIHKCSMYYKIYTNPHLPPAPSPTVMASYASYDSRRRSCVARRVEVIGIAMVQSANKTTPKTCNSHTK